MYFGFHISISDGLTQTINKALRLKCTSIQIFPGNPRSWKIKPFLADEIGLFKIKRKKNKIKYVLIHTPYLVSLATPNDEVAQKSMNLLKDSIKKAQQIKAEYVVTHLGSGLGAPRDKTMERIVHRLKYIDTYIPENVKLLIENTSGVGFTMGTRLEEFKYYLHEVSSLKLGVALDVCHLFAAGYDISSNGRLNIFLQEFDSQIGLNNLFCLHLNDSLYGLGSRKDRHAGIGKGKIGLAGFKAIVNHPLLNNLPAVMETPGRKELDDIKNMNKLLSLVDKTIG